MLQEIEKLLDEVTRFGLRHGWSDTRIGEEYGDRAVIHRARRGLAEGRVRLQRGTIKRLRTFMARTDVAA
jgi:hypothetical protein